MDIRGTGGAAGSIGHKIPAQGSEQTSSTAKVDQALTQATGDTFEKPTENRFAALARSGLAQALRPEIPHQEGAINAGPEANCVNTVLSGSLLSPAGEDRAIIFVGGQPDAGSLQDRQALEQQATGDLVSKLVASGLDQAGRSEISDQEKAGLHLPAAPEPNCHYTVLSGNLLSPADEDRAIIFVGGQPSADPPGNYTAGDKPDGLDQAVKTDPNKPD